MERRYTPYERAPLRLKCVASISRRVATGYSFGDTVRATWSTNELRALCDGKAVYSLTLKGTDASKVEDEWTYMFKNLVLKGDRAYFNHNTTAFKSYDMEVDPELVAMAVNLLCPPSVHVDNHISLRETEGYVTVNAQIASVGDVRQVVMKGTPIPIRDVDVTMAGQKFLVTLWREVSLLKISVGDWVTLTHMRPSNSPSFGFKLNSSTYTEVHQIEAAASDRDCTIVGVSSGPQFYTLLLGCGTELKVPIQSWVGTEDNFISRLPLKVTLELQGDLVVSPKALFKTPEQANNVDEEVRKVVEMLEDP